MVMLSEQVTELALDDFDWPFTQIIVLPDIGWSTYRAMLTDMGDDRASRIAYYQGLLTLKMPSKLHEIINRLLARIVTTLTEELDLEIVNIGSATLERDDLEAGAEPDTGFYIQNALNLEGLDPDIPARLPPDLVVEVDITSPSTKRLGIYQVLGVPEVWQYNKRKGLIIYQLQQDSSDSKRYVETDNSAAFSKITASQLNAFLSQRQTQSENQVIRSVRKWVEENN